MYDGGYVGIIRTKTKRGIEEEERCAKRVKECGENFNNVQNVLKELFDDHITIKKLIDKAEELMKYKGVTPVDRDAKRKKKSLICWFVENWKIIEPYCRPNKTKSPPQLFGSNACSDDDIFKIEFFDAFSNEK